MVTVNPTRRVLMVTANLTRPVTVPSVNPTRPGPMVTANPMHPATVLTASPTRRAQMATASPMHPVTEQSANPTRRAQTVTANPMLAKTGMRRANPAPNPKAAVILQPLTSRVPPKHMPAKGPMPA